VVVAGADGAGGASTVGGGTGGADGGSGATGAGGGPSGGSAGWAGPTDSGPEGAVGPGPGAASVVTSTFGRAGSAWAVAFVVRSGGDAAEAQPAKVHTKSSQRAARALVIVAAALAAAKGFGQVRWPRLRRRVLQPTAAGEGHDGEPASVE
jgi:hypothetical protein